MLSADKLIADALQLPREERARVAHELLTSLDGPEDEGVQDAWAAEIAKRAQAVEAGTAVLEDWSVARQRILARLQDDQGIG